MFEVLENGQVMKVEEIATRNQIAVIKTPCGMKKRLILVANKTSVLLEEIVTLQVKWQEFNIATGLYDDTITENSDIIIKITGPGQPVEFSLTTIAGQAEFDFQSPVAGTFTIQAKSIIPCDPAEIEVTVSE